jgi:predicted RecB family nuclease
MRDICYLHGFLERLGLSGKRNPFVWDIHGEEVEYDLDAPQGARIKDSLWVLYETCLYSVKSIIFKKERTLPALAADCKLCHWRTACKKEIKAYDDLSLIPELGRTRRDTMLSHINSVSDLAKCNISDLIQGKKTVFPGIGPDMLKKFQERAELLNRPNSRPYIKNHFMLPTSDVELFFDVETDPMRDICYLHGFLERRGSEEKYVSFFAESPEPEDEEQAFLHAWEYIQSSQPCSIYYYSHYEKTTLKKLQKKYPNVVSEEEIEELFNLDRSIDLYTDIVKKNTEWPTNDYSLKTLAAHLGFKWRDTDPSGAASIEWYHRWVETGDKSVRERILEYNEDDCIATMVLLDGIMELAIK